MNREKLLTNLEESIYHMLIEKHSINDNSNVFRLCNFDENTLNKNNISTYLNIEFSFNPEIILVYNGITKIKFIDIDIINLILKFIQTCGKVLCEKYSISNINNNSNLKINNQALITSSIKTVDYFINKYGKQINKQTNILINNHVNIDIDKLMLAIGLNILVPYSEEYCRDILKKKSNII